MTASVHKKIKPIPFKVSRTDTIGMEIEFQLLDPVSLDLTEGILPLMQRYRDHTFIKPEFIQNTVEVASPICHSIAELDHQVRLLVKDLMANCRDLGIALVGAGTHPYNRGLAKITPTPRFLAIEEAEGYNSHTQITFATHVHIGMRSGDEAITVMRGLMRYLPLLIALSANSPYWRGFDTHYDSFRHYVLGAVRSYGQPPEFKDWQEFSEFYTAVKQVGIFETINDIHWDIRPRPHLGSLEIRVMDAQPTVADSVALAAMIQALVAYLRSEVTPQGQCTLNTVHHWINRDNYYKAAQHGLKANYIDELRGETLPILQIYDEIKDRILPVVAELGTQVFFAQLGEIVSRGGNAQLQRKLYKDTHTLKRMLGTLVTVLDDDVNGKNL